MTEEAPQRVHSRREVFNSLRWLVRAGAQWRMMPNDLPPWEAVHQQTQRWLRAGVFEAIVHDLRVVLRPAHGRTAQPSAAVLDSRTLQCTPESGARTGYDGGKGKRGSKVHMAVDTPGHLLARHVTAASEQERAQVAQMAAQVQDFTGAAVEVAFADQGYPGAQPAQDAAAHGMRLEIVNPPEAKPGFVPLPRRWVVERSCARAARFRRLSRDYEQLPATLAGLHFLVFAILILSRFVEMMTQGVQHAQGAQLW